MVTLAFGTLLPCPSSTVPSTVPIPLENCACAVLLNFVVANPERSKTAITTRTRLIPHLTLVPEEILRGAIVRAWSETRQCYRNATPVRGYRRRCGTRYSRRFASVFVVLARRGVFRLFHTAAIGARVPFER